MVFIKDTTSAYRHDFVLHMLVYKVYDVYLSDV